MFNLASSADWQIAVRRDNVIIITLRQVYYRRISLSYLLFLNQVATQLSSRGCGDPDLHT